MGRVSRGVIGIRLREGDRVVDMVVADQKQKSALLTVCENGHGKRTGLDNYRAQSRGGVGLINIKTTVRNGKVVALKSVQHSDELMLITAKGIIIRTGLDQIRSIGRNTQGVRLIKLSSGDKLVAVAKIVSENSVDKGEQKADSNNLFSKVSNNTEKNSADKASKQKNSAKANSKNKSKSPKKKKK